MALHALRIELEYRGSPLRVVFIAVFLEQRRIIFDVYARGNEVVADELHYAVIWPYLGIQPGTAASHRSSAKIEQNGFVLLGSVTERVVDVVSELDFHTSLAAISGSPPL